jgi:hypothetical protein
VLDLEHDKTHSNFAYNYKLRRFNLGRASAPHKAECRRPAAA